MIEFTKQTLEICIAKFTLQNEELNKYWSMVEKLEMQSHNRHEVGMHKIFQTIIPAFYALLKVSESDSISSLQTLNRMIIDNYSVLYLLAINGTARERNIRYYLFLLDGIKSRSGLLTNFNANVSESLKDKSSTLTALNHDISTIRHFRNLIDEINIDGYINEKIITDYNWKFKNPNDQKTSRQNQYSWTELYEIARIPKKYSYVFQSFYSSFVHGLGMTIMKQPDDNKFLLAESVFEIAAIIQALVAKILFLQYSNYIKEDQINPVFLYVVNSHWEKWNKH